MSGAAWEYWVVFLTTAISCMALTPLVIRYATSWDLLDRPGGHKSHEEAVPYLGGIAIAVTFAAAVLVVSTVWPPSGNRNELLTVLGLATVVSIVGFVDDLRPVSPVWRLITEVAVSIIVWSMGTGVSVTGIESIDLALTVLWFVGITNALNLLDNMDGLAAGLSTIISLTIFAIAVATGQFLVATAAIGLAGCTAGFLRHNFHPARIYMGDGGALFVGFLIAYLGIKLRSDGNRIVSALVPAIACSVAVFDTTLVTISRLASGRSPFLGGQDHISHRLVKIGLTVPIAVGTIYFGAIGIAVLTYTIHGADARTGALLISLILFTLLVTGGFLLTVDVYPDGSSHADEGRKRANED
jgi:UDP-GlcNAc:undecaprenyl-phosphate GlcNAc-1-phosphate transferase